MPVIIPENITVHLGTPDDAAAQNVIVPFIDYIKNVASSEIYPTWPESSLRANIYAQISYALNRIYTEYYPSRGYNFDITNSTAIDQSFVYGRDIFENISLIVDDIFDEYLRRQGNIEPLFAQYCNGTTVICDGLSQWGSVVLANDGLTPYQILTSYYGNDIDIVRDTPIGQLESSYPGIPLEIGFSSNQVKTLQVRLNRISNNYPSIPKIYPVDGNFGISTDEAVRKFQEIFDLEVDGKVGKATWNQVQRIYGGVKRLNELQSEGISPVEAQPAFPESIEFGDNNEYVRILQYILNVIAQSNPAVPSIIEDGIFGNSTRDAIIAFQKEYGLTPNGEINSEVWNTMFRIYRGVILALPEYYGTSGIVPFPGLVLSLGVTGNGVSLLQTYLNELSSVYPEIPEVPVTDVFSPQTDAAVRAFQELFGYPVNGVVGVIVWDGIADATEDLRYGNNRAEGQYPGYDIGE